MADSNILITPEFIQMKFEEARARLGKHIMVGVSYSNGVVVGKTFNARSNEIRRGFWTVGSGLGTVLVAAIGDYRDLIVLKSATKTEELTLIDWITSRYTTCRAVIKTVSGIFESALGDIKDIAADVVCADTRENMFWLVDMSMRTRNFADFVVTGAPRYSPEIRPDAFPKDERDVMLGVVQNPSPELESRIKKRFTDAAAYFSKFDRPTAVEYLKQQCKRMPYAKRNKELAILLVAKTLIRFDPPSESECFELAFLEREQRGDTINVRFKTDMHQLTPKLRKNRQKYFSLPADNNDLETKQP